MSNTNTSNTSTNNNNSYTMQLVDSMMQAMLTTKISANGWTRLSNGLYEDFSGQVHTVTLDQTHTVGIDGDDLYTVTLKLCPVSVAGRI